MSIKLSEYCKLNGISYITGYRWFKAKQIPGAFQTPSGTILIDEGPDPSTTPETISAIVSKTAELSATNASLADLASYVISNFTLIPNDHTTSLNNCHNLSTNTSFDLQSLNNGSNIFYCGENLNVADMVLPKLEPPSEEPPKEDKIKPKRHQKSNNK